jgi:hypothetical protein
MRQLYVSVLAPSKHRPKKPDFAEDVRLDDRAPTAKGIQGPITASSPLTDLKMLVP